MQIKMLSLCVLCLDVNKSLLLHTETYNLASCHQGSLVALCMQVACTDLLWNRDGVLKTRSVWRSVLVKIARQKMFQASRASQPIGCLHVYFVFVYCQFWVHNYVPVKLN